MREMENSGPLVSIVIPTFNQRAEFLRDAIQSVLNQTYSNFEIIVSDNHSTNDVPDVLAEFEDERLRVVKPPKHLPLIENFHFAGEAAEGKFISFLPSDDVVEPQWLEVLVPLLMSSPTAVLSFGEVAGVKHANLDAVLYTNRGNAIASGELSPLDVWRLVLPFGRKAGWLVGGLVRTSAYRLTGGILEPGFSLCADHTLLVKLLAHGGAIYVNQLVGRHRVWGFKDGKVDGNRSMRSIRDVCNLFEFVERSASYQTHIGELKEIVLEAKVSRAKLMSLLLLQGRAVGQLSDSELREGTARIRSLSSSRFVRVMARLAGIGLVTSSIDLTYGVCIKFYRSFLARHYNT